MLRALLIARIIPPVYADVKPARVQQPPGESEAHLGTRDYIQRYQRRIPVTDMRLGALAGSRLR
jgi:hypothetical protein